MGSLAKVVEDCFGVLQVYNDGTIYRASDSQIIGEHFNNCITNNNHDNSNSSNNNNKFRISEDGCYVEWEDCIYDEQNKLYLRVYKPIYDDDDGIVKRKMPIVYYLHGGGFCLGSRIWPNCHNCCLRLSSQLHAFVITPDYRLAPEHRLPAAIEDGVNTMKWIQAQVQATNQIGVEKLLFGQNDNNNNNNNSCSKLMLGDDHNNGVDFEQVFILGDSSGGNIAHHLAVHFGSGSPNLNPVRVQGYVMLAPFFGGIPRTPSEIQAPNEPTLNLDSLDRFWRLSLPIGATRDHEFANPFGPNSPNLEMVSLDPMLVIVGGEEIMKDRVQDYAKRLREMGKIIKYVELQGQHHGFLTQNPYSETSNKVFQLIKQFMFERKSSC